MWTRRMTACASVNYTQAVLGEDLLLGQRLRKDPVISAMGIAYHVTDAFLELGELRRGQR